MTTPTPGQSAAASTTEVLATTIAAVVERQLTQYVQAMAQQVDAARRSAEESKAQLRVEFQNQLAVLGAQQQALQAALETRLGEFSQHQQRRLNEVENRLLEMPAAGASGASGFDAGELASLREQMDSQSAAAHARIDDLHKLAITLQHLLPGSERTQALRKYARLRDTAQELKWFLVVQREAIGLTDHGAVEQHYAVPRAIAE